MGRDIIPGRMCPRAALGRPETRALRGFVTRMHHVRSEAGSSSCRAGALSVRLPPQYARQEQEEEGRRRYEAQKLERMETKWRNGDIVQPVPNPGKSWGACGVGGWCVNVLLGLVGKQIPPQDHSRLGRQGGSAGPWRSTLLPDWEALEPTCPRARGSAAGQRDACWRGPAFVHSPPRLLRSGLGGLPASQNRPVTAAFSRWRESRGGAQPSFPGITFRSGGPALTEWPPTVRTVGPGVVSSRKAFLHPHPTPTPSPTQRAQGSGPLTWQTR